jgi:predicted Fe-Mo cluster-binding NifX family protein
MITEEDPMTLRDATIAIATDDGSAVSSHFGRARYYEVIRLEGGKVMTRERREKAGHHAFAQGDGGHENHDGGTHDQRHQAMTSPIADCAAVIARGMGQGAVDHMQRANLLPVLTGLATIEEVLGAIAADSLENDPRRIHHHHGQ